uniref:Small ribosomal subunit protein uS4c n=1 Tax=Trentepohlia odorata TaxID=2576626 RepID=A0A4Y5P3G6_9CHLO|nr:ribosomal protein S4 [Trentepohlia odorata]QCW57792.1 ribosomal protein S4 [Trentepohlia odorata]
MRYTGPKLKIVRNLGLQSLPAFTTKSQSKKNIKKKKRPKSFLFSNRLKEKQKIRYNFNINNNQLFNYLKKAKKISGLAAKNNAKTKKELIEIKNYLTAEQAGLSSSDFSNKNDKKQNNTPKDIQQLPRFKKNSKLNRLFLVSKSKQNFFLTSNINQIKKPANSNATKSLPEKNVGSTGDELIKLLESRFDSIIFRLYFAPTINMARQLISHGHFLINNKKVNIPSYHCNINDKITVRSKSKNLIEDLYSKIIQKNSLATKKRQKTNKKMKKYVNQMPFYLTLDRQNLAATINNEVSNYDSTIRFYYKSLKLRILYVIEFFSRQL